VKGRRNSGGQCFRPLERAAKTNRLKLWVDLCRALLGVPTEKYADEAFFQERFVRVLQPDLGSARGMAGRGSAGR
jgi:hypothetical protein